VLCDLGDGHWVNALEKIGGPWDIADAGKTAFGAVTRGADREKVDAAWNAIEACTRIPEELVRAEGPQVRMLARRIREAAGEAARIDAEIGALLEHDPTYECLFMAE
jgi:hypothetical protein